MGEWVRLTPKNDIPLLAPVEWAKNDDLDTHIIRYEGTPGVEITPAEALAFARQLPEVKALGTQLQAVMWTLENVLNSQGGRWDLVLIKACRTSLELGQKALTSFTESADAT